jgi:hypothetical protein
MKRFSATLFAMLLIVLLAVGCAGADPDAASPEDEDPATAGDDAPALVSAAAPDPIPVEGPGESAAANMLSVALETARAADAGTHTWPDLADAEGILSAYLVRVDMDGQTALFEVRADGIPHSIYAYQRPFDSGTIVWMSADVSPVAKSAPRSEGERTATEAVRAAMADAFEGATFEVSVFGYRFSYVRDGELLLNLVFEPRGEFSAAEWPR